MTTKPKKIALVCICLNQPYWEFVRPMIASAREFFLSSHNVDYFLWSDMPEENDMGATVIPTEPIEWPMPTLLRYNLFLQQEQKLKEYDYIFYCDADMRFVSTVGDEILGDGLTAAQHPMYALRKQYIPPYEPNQMSTAYIKRAGTIMFENGSPRLEPVYAAGGFQGGKTEDFIKAMKVMKQRIDEDLANDYIAIWNDESHWNRYLLDNPPAVVLSPSYVYPDSLIKSYYEKLWGRNFLPRIITITKKFTLSKEGGQAVNQTIQNL